MSGFSFRPAHRWLSVYNPPTVFCLQRICPSVVRAAAVRYMRRQGAQNGSLQTGPPLIQPSAQSTKILINITTPAGFTTSIPSSLSTFNPSSPLRADRWRRC